MKSNIHFLVIGLLVISSAAVYADEDELPSLPTNGSSSFGPADSQRIGSGNVGRVPGHSYGAPYDKHGNIYGDPQETSMSAAQLLAAGYKKCSLYDDKTNSCRIFAMTDQEREDAINSGIKIGREGQGLLKLIDQRIKESGGY